MNHLHRASRRQFLTKSGVIMVASAFTRAGLFAAEPKKEEEEVSPAEDLMREHGVLKRVLLVYGEAIRRIEMNEDLPPETVMDSAKIIRNFIENYHEKLEEDFLFPEFRRIVSKNEYDSLGEDFEKKEHELFGEDGFEKMVDKVAGIEKKLGIYDLARFTPKV